MINIKRGDTFRYVANITDEGGNPIITNVENIRSQVRDRKYNLISNLSVSPTDKKGRYLLEAKNTDDWHIQSWGENILLMDIELDLGGVITSSETIKINVIRDVSY